MQIHSIGIDLGKTTFHLVALGAAGKVVIKKARTHSQPLRCSIQSLGSGGQCT